MFVVVGARQLVCFMVFVRVKAVYVDYRVVDVGAVSR